MTIALFRCIDFETSRKDDGSVIEAGWTDVYLNTETRERTVGTPRSLLFFPPGGLDPGAQGVHHLTMRDLAGQPEFGPDDIRDLVGADAPNFLVAHNAEYERGFITEEFTPPGVHWICTFKAALRAWEEAPEHNLQALRYWRGLDLDPALAMPAHRAGPDSYVNAMILAELLATELARDLVKWTIEPRHYARCPIGAHRGKPWDDLPYDYLTWIVNKAREMEPDVQHAARRELARRASIGA